MTEFVGHAVGNRHYSYPETPRASASAASAFARNFASGPATLLAVTNAGIQIPWTTRDVAGVGPEDVPITPKTTGIIRVHAVLSLRNTTGTVRFLQVKVQVNDVDYTIPVTERVTVPANANEADGYATLSVLVELLPAATIGVLKQIQIFVSADADGAVFLNTNSSTIEVEEVPVSTG